MARTGPTQGAERHADSVRRWKSHPRLAAILRVLVFVAPITFSLVLTWAGAKWLPPARLGISRWAWIIGAFIIANCVLMATAKLTRRLTPLVALLKLSLVFPDNAPPRAKAMLRRSNSRKLLRDMEEARARGEQTGETQHGVLLVHLLRELNNHDRLTRGHSERVRAYSEMIGEELDLPEEDMQKLRWASLLHDVGKLDVPAEILNKDGRPDEDEWKILQTHPTAGGVRLEELRPWLGDWVHAADQHHLRWDGAGYPSSLSGTDISLPGRLVAVADAYDVMTSTRSYKAPLSYEIARHELTACAGSQFDPAMVRAFLNVGLGRIRAVVGPVSWAANALGSLQVPAPVVTAVGTTVAAAASVAIGTFGGLPTVESPPRALGVVAPVEAQDVSVDAVEDEPIEIVLRARGGNGELSFSVGKPEHGTMVLGAVQTVQDDPSESADPATLSVTYVPPENFSGSDSFEFEACDSERRCDNGSGTITIAEVNDAPVAAGVFVSAIAGETSRLDVPPNDTDVEGGQIRFVEVRPFANGYAELVDGMILLTPDRNFEGPLEFQYVIVDDGGAEAVGTIVAVVTKPNEAPAASPDIPSMAEDGSILIDVLENDSDPDGDDLAIVGVAEPSHGTASIVDGRLLYIPVANYNGYDTFEYWISDGRNPDVRSIVSVTIASVNDPPIVTSPSIAMSEAAIPGVVITTLTATDPEGDPISYSIAGGDPTGRFSIDPLSGTFTLAAALDFETASSHPLTIEATDGSLVTATVVVITIVDVDEPPTAKDDSLSVVEDELTVLPIGANDDDPEGASLTFVVPPTSTAGGTLAVVAGVISYAPPPAYTGPDSFSYTVSDPAGHSSGPATVSLVVTPVNDAPVLGALGPQSGDEEVLLTFTVGATDIDLPANALTYTLAGTIPAGAVIDPTTGDFTWTPAESQDGTYTFDVVVTDDGTPNLSDTETITITVNDVNVAPVLDAIGPQDGDETTLFSFTATTMDIDLPANGLTYTLAGAVPAGATIDPATGDFTWTPTEAQDGSYSFDVVATDDGTPNLTDSETITVIVNEINTTPVLDAIGPQSGDELTAISFAASATDTDAPVDGLTFSLAGMIPVGAAIDPTTGNFTWTPTETQDGTYTFDVVVTDDGTPNLSDSETITITVADVNLAPVLDAIGPQAVDEEVLLTFTAGATDNDLPADLLTYTLAGTVPAGATIDPSTGNFTWTPTETQDGTYTFDVVVTDDGTPNLSDSETITVNVADVNEAPVLSAIGPQFGNESSLFSFTASASDPDDTPANGLTFSLTGTVPAGASIDPTTGDFTWSPTEAQSGTRSIDVIVTDDGTPNLSHSETVVFTVNEINSAPVLDAIGPQAGDELTAITFTATATDSDLPVNGMNYTLSGPVPAGATIDPTTGDFTWTPGESQDGSYTFDILVTDDGTPNLSDGETITITINDVNSAPVLDAIGPQVIDEEVLLTFTATATDSDLPADALTFTLAGTVPAGATIDPMTGDFSWTPNEAQDGAHTFDVVVTDNGTPNLSDTETITITVNGVNVPPVLAAIPDPTMAYVGVPFSFIANATDADLPTQTLSYNITGLPGWAAWVDNGDGTATISGTAPTGTLGATAVTVTVDDGSLNDVQTFTLDVSMAISPQYGDIVINEVLYRQRPGFTEEFVELYNASAGPIDLTGWTLASQNNAAGDPVDINYTIPASDELARPSILPVGGYAVIWIQTRGGAEVAPLAALEFAIGGGLVVDNDGEEFYVLDSAGEVVDYMEYGDRLEPFADFGTAPTSTIWDDTYSIANLLAAGEGQSISLTASGVDNDHSACWEATGSGDAGGRPECTGAPLTIDTDPTARQATPGTDNNNLYVASPFAGQIVVNEVLMRTIVGFPEEFVELHNIGPTAVDLTNFRVLDGNRHLGETDTNPLDVFIPPVDVNGTPSILPPGGHAVVWASTHLGAAGVDAPLADLQFESGIPSNWVLDDSDEVWVLDPTSRLVDFVAWGSGGELGTPPLFGWDSAYQGAIDMPANGQSISLTPNGVDGNLTACWEHTGSGQAGLRAECLGQPSTIDSDPVPPRVTSLGRSNN